MNKSNLFSCFTGLRLSDVRSLTWGKILDRPDSKGKFVRVLMQKTQRYVNIPLSSDALACLYEKENPDEPIFTLPMDPTICYHIRKWTQAAEIRKKITFHCAIHTFATLSLAAGADIATVSSILGHTTIRTTQLYAKVLMDAQVAAINSLPSYGVVRASQ